MADFEQMRKEFIEKLEKADATFDKIFQADADGLVIHGEDRANLQTMKDENQKMLHKLKSREFSVSIVGLEKAGKSTLGSALIKDKVLPDDATRCTYTTTEIRAGSEDIAEVSFYTRDNFNKNFKRMLDEVGYEGSGNFETMTLNAFENYWKIVRDSPEPEKKNLYRTFNTNTADDIKTILAGKEIINRLIGSQPKYFGSEYWRNNDSNEFNEFKTYITGATGRDSNNVIIRTAHPYAVERVVIRSTELKTHNMDHMVLYDVPGFNSPTRLHKEQTKKMLKDSDAIILVTNVGTNPDLTSEQLDMLQTAMNAQDNYGVDLNEKAFVFANRIDEVNGEDDEAIANAKGNLATLKKQIVDNGIALAKNIVGGSARAFLEKENIIRGKASQNKIDKLQLEHGDGVEWLFDTMQHYYNNDRFTVLKKQADNTLTKTREMIESLLDRYKIGEIPVGNVSTEIVQEIQAKLGDFDKNANVITTKHKNVIKETLPFTTNLKDNIPNIYQLSESHDQLILDAELQQNITADDVYQVSHINPDIRRKLEIKFKDNIVSTAVELTMSQQKELRDLLVEDFLQVMGMESTSTYKEDLEKSVNKLFDDMLIEGGKSCNFNSLVERFAGTIITVLILTPYADDQRYGTVERNLADLISLSVYYNMPQNKDDNEDENEFDLNNISEKSKEFFAAVIAHEGREIESEEDISDNENYLNKFIKDNKDDIYRGLNIATELIPVGRWVKFLMKAGVNLAKISSNESIKTRDKLDNKLQNLILNTGWDKKDENERKESIEGIFQNYLSSFNTNSASNSISDYLKELNEKAKKNKSMKTKEDMLAILDADIEILRDITSRAVINAIDLEKAYIAVITKNVGLIREHLREGEGAKAFRAWCRDNAQKLMPSQFESVIETETMNRNRKAIVDAIEKLLNQWEV